MRYTIFSPMKVAAAAPPPALTLIHHWDPSEPLTEVLGLVSSMPNQVGGGPAAVQGNATLQPTWAPLETDGDGPSALNALHFDGVDDRLEVTLPAEVSTFVMLAFFISADTTPTQTIMGILSGDVAPLLQMGAVAGRFNILLSPGGVVAQTSAAGIATGSAFAIGVAYDGTTLRIDRHSGSSPGSSASAGVKLANGSTFYIGGADTKTSFNGQIADVQVWENWSGDATELGVMVEDFWNATFTKYYP